MYFGGDIIWKTNKKATALLASLNGHKRIVLGNHDDADYLFKTGLFQRIYMWKYFPDENFIFSHVPLVERDLKRAAINVHGHTHDIMINDSRYINVCVEPRGYIPMHISQISKQVKNTGN